jgi:hypothetical protein
MNDVAVAALQTSTARRNLIRAGIGGVLSWVS